MATSKVYLEDMVSVSSVVSSNFYYSKEISLVEKCCQDFERQKEKAQTCLTRTV